MSLIAGPNVSSRLQPTIYCNDRVLVSAGLPPPICCLLETFTAVQGTHKTYTSFVPSSGTFHGIFMSTWRSFELNGFPFTAASPLHPALKFILCLYFYLCPRYSPLTAVGSGLLLFRRNLQQAPADRPSLSTERRSLLFTLIKFLLTES